MRQLRFAGVSDDGSHLIVEPLAPSPDPAERFAVLVDDGLRSALAPVPAAAAPVPGDNPPPAVEAAPAEEPAEIVPRDIQVRVRSGESPDEVAASLGVAVERIMRFAAPVVDERLRIADEARRSRARITAPEGAENKIVIFGEAVDSRFGAYGIVADDVRWDSHRRDDGEWVVRAEWTGGAGTHDAHWIFHRATRTVTAVDDAAADLLSDRPIRPVVPPPPVKLAAAPPLVPGIVAFPPMPDAHTGPVPVVDDVFDQDAPSEGPRVLPPYTPQRRRPAESQARDAASQADDAGLAAVPSVWSVEATLDDLLDGRDEHDSAEQVLEPTLDSAFDPALDEDAPPLPLGIAGLTNRVKREREPSDAERAARSRVPSWDDILLGVRRKSD